MGQIPPDLFGKLSERCECCGQRLPKLWPHRMDRTKLELLAQIARINLKHRWVKLQRDGNLITEECKGSTIQCDDVHGRRLLWFGLLNEKGPRTGEYRVTLKAIYFLAGRTTVPARIWCSNGRVIRSTDEGIRADAIKNVTLDKDYWDKYPTEH